MSGTVFTNRHTTIPNDSGPISACFDDDANLFYCEIAQPSNSAYQKYVNRFAFTTFLPDWPVLLGFRDWLSLVAFLICFPNYRSLRMLLARVALPITFTQCFPG